MLARSCALIMLASVGACSDAREPASKDADAPEKPLPSFEFRGLVPEVTTVAEAEKLDIVRSCTNHKETYGSMIAQDDIKDETSCFFSKYNVGGVGGVFKTSVTFRKDKFDWFSIKFHTDSFDHLNRLLNNVYGKPCRIESKVLQNSFGVEFPGDEVWWCFSQGDLKLRRHTRENYRHGELTYFTAHPEDIAPRTVHNSNSL